MNTSVIYGEFASLMVFDDAAREHGSLGLEQMSSDPESFDLRVNSGDGDGSGNGDGYGYGYGLQMSIGVHL